ncbi:MAG: hypothetical protein WCK74_10330 [Gemmatimonadaceae bacterium]|jgi:dimethylargininase
MAHRFTRALVRPLTDNFADGLTSVTLGAPDIARAHTQWQAYVDALGQAGLHVETLPGLPSCPDATFVEDTAVLLPGLAVLTRPGAPSRAPEVDAIRDAVHRIGYPVREIMTPGTLDGGDVCEHGDHLFIGISHRTNADGARQLAAFAAEVGMTASTIDIRDRTDILHLKSGLVSIDDALLVAIPGLATHSAIAGLPVLVADEREAYAANCVRVNDRVLVADGFPVLCSALSDRGFEPLPLAMSEFQKMDGGLSCLSLRF